MALLEHAGSPNQCPNWVNMRNTRSEHSTPGVPSITEIARSSRDFRVVPIGDIRLMSFASQLDEECPCLFHIKWDGRHSGSGVGVQERVLLFCLASGTAPRDRAADVVA